MDELPQELIDKIISSIDGVHRRSVLCACSCVCRSWRRQAQKELFRGREIKFFYRGWLEDWHRDIPLDSKISSYVRGLSWDIQPVIEERGDPFLEYDFPGRFAAFSNIESLRVSAISLRFVKITALKHIFGHLGHSLRRLFVKRLTTDLETWCTLVSLLPNLQTMDTHGVTMLDKQGPGPDHPLTFDFTGHLGSYCEKTEEFFRCIAGLNPRLESFRAYTLTEDLIDTLNFVVQSCSTTLTTIAITPPSPGMEGA